MRGPPVVLTNTLGRPVTNVISERGAVPMTVVNTLGEPVTLVNSGGEPVTLFNANGTLWDYPFSLFSNNEQGAWYDPSDYSTLYQNAAGTTPVTAVEQPVRLMLDRSRGLVLGGELVTNGDFASDTAWTKDAGWTITGGAAVATSAGVLTSIRQNITTVSGRLYRLEYTCSSYTVGLFSSRVGGSIYETTTSGTGVRTTLFVATSSSTEIAIIQRPGLAPNDVLTAAFDSVSVKELPGNHALAPNDASRPVLRSRYNLLTYSEQFDNAVWAKITTTVTANTDTAPDGTVTADTVAATGANSLIYQVVSGLSNSTTYTLSVWVRTITVGTTATLAFYTGGGGTTIGSQSFTTTGSWQRVTLTATTGTLSGETWFAIGGANTFATGETFYIWGAQLLTAADQASTGGAYQRIAAATDYDTSNPVWRPYLAFDGTDDFFNLASAINITTDMTVVRGFGRSAAGINSLGFAHTAATPHAGTWNAGDNVMYGALGNAQGALGSASTATGFYVDVVSRNVTTESARRNGAALGSRSAATVSGSLSTVGRLNTLYNLGPVYGLILLDRELTGSELTATEQWMAGKTGATLA